VTEDELVEHVARAIFDASTEKARRESAHVATWETVAEYWRVVHRTAIAAVREAGGLF